MQLFRRLSFTMLLMSMMTLVACGGGDGDLTGGGDGGTTGVVTLTVSKSDGDLSAANDVTVSATVVDNGSAVVNKTVTFTLAVEGSATFDPVAGTATTDANGVATIVVKVSDVPGSVNVIASYESATDNISFDSAGDGIKVVEGEPTAATITLFASTQQLASSGAETITLTAIAKDANNHLVAGVPINFSVTSGTIGGVENSEGEISNVTDINGRVQKGLITPANPENRTITVNVSSSDGDVTDSLEIDVIGTSITLTGSRSLALNDKSNYIVRLVDSDGKAIANTPVALSLSGEATEEGGDIASITFSPAGNVTTDFNGQATVTVIGTTGGTNALIVTAQGTSASQAVSVQADSFLFSEFDDGSGAGGSDVDGTVPEVLLSDKAMVTLTWNRSGVPVVGQEVTFTTTRGSLNQSTALTDAEGKVTVEVSSTNAGKALLTFTGIDVGAEIELTNQLEFEFVADAPYRLIAQIYPQSIAPNNQTSTMSVVVRDEQGNLVKNQIVDFVLIDTNGGSISPASARTDSNGSASTVYTSNTTSAHNGVSITATVRGIPDGQDPIEDKVELTVADREVSIRLGTGNTILQHDNNTYNKQYSVFVTDIDSNPVPNVTLTVSAIPKEYFKGSWIAYLDDEGEFEQWGPGDRTVVPHQRGYRATCANEDSNGNSVLDDLLGEEDTNTDGLLTPGNIVNAQGSVTTDEYGIALIDIRYAEVYGFWANIELIVSTQVNGTESFAKVLFNLDALTDDVNNEDLAPATFIWPSGPFGQSNLCTNPD